MLSPGALKRVAAGNPTRRWKRLINLSEFNQPPQVAEGFPLKNWRGGPEAGKPKIPPTARGLLERGLMRLDTGQRLALVYFTAAGLVALRAMMTDRRLADPKKFAHARQELGIDPVADDSQPENG